MSEPSPRYYEALRATQEFHATHKTFTGRFLIRYSADVKALIEEYDCKTMLDYGCGKGRQWSEPMDLENPSPMLADFLGLKRTNITLYDPGVPKFEEEPEGKFDIVVCTQALGSIPIADLPWAVERLYGFANKCVYVAERLAAHVKKDIHHHMIDEMPHGWTREQWVEVLKRPDSDVPGYFRTNEIYEKL